MILIGETSANREGECEEESWTGLVMMMMMKKKNGVGKFK
jgi:hypothetical protein